MTLFRGDWARELRSSEREDALRRELARRGLPPDGLDPAAREEIERALDREDFARALEGGSLPAEAREAAADPARTLGDYVLVTPLGSGGMGDVWKAWDRRMNRWVAVKVSNLSASSKDAWERFKREVRAAGRLQHPGIVPIHGDGDWNGRPYIVMQYIDGETLDTRRLSLRQALEVGRVIALALDHAHARQVVHRDVKPGNILIDTQGAAWLLDFGIALLTEGGTRLTTAGAVIGTPEYMPPEQARGEPSAAEERLDIYGLGATLYDLATGQPPFSGESFAEVLRKVERDEPVPPRKLNRRLPRDVETVILKAMEKDPARRYARAADLAEDLRRCLAGEPILARPPAAWERGWRFARRRPLPLALAASLAAAALLGAWAWERSRTLDVAAREREQERELALALLRETSRVSLEAALALRREGANERMKAFLGPLEESYRQALERAPDLAEVEYRMGRMKRALMDDEAALAHQDKALAKDPDYAPALYERALLVAKKHAATLRDAPDPRALRMILDDCTRLESILKEGPALVSGMRVSEAHLSAARGVLAYYQDRIPEAIAALTKAVEADSGMEEAWETLAKAVALRPGVPGERARREAIEIYTRGLAHDRGYAPLLLGRGEARMTFVYDALERGDDPGEDLSGAERDYLEAVRLHPENAQTWHRLADLRSNQAFRARGRGQDPLPLFEEAERLFTRSLDMDPRLDAAWRGRGIVRTYWGRFERERGGDAAARWAGAVDDLRRYLALVDGQPAWKSADALMRIGTARMEAGAAAGVEAELAGAEEDFARALKLWPQAKTWSRRGAARLARAEASADPRPHLAAAEGDLAKAVELDPKLAEAWLKLGVARSRRARTEDVFELAEAAARDLTRAIELNKGFAEAWSERARLRLWMMSKDPARARAYYDMAAADGSQAVQIDPTLASGLQAALERAR